MRSLAIIVLALSLSGCAVAMSANRSVNKGDPAMIRKGADRAVIESTFGPPSMTASISGNETKVVYKIDPSAASEGGRAAAVAGHAVADVMTLGLWEVVGTPLELGAQDEFTTYVVVYGKDDKIKSVETYQ